MNKNTFISISCKNCGKKVKRTANSQKYCKECSQYTRLTRRVDPKLLRKTCEICKRTYKARQRNQKICSNLKCREKKYGQTSKKEKDSEAKLIAKMRKLGYEVTKK